MPRRLFAVALAIVVAALVLIACGGGLTPDRKPIETQQIGTFASIKEREAGVQSLTAPNSPNDPEPPDPSNPPPPKVADLCPPKGQAARLSRAAQKINCDVIVKRITSRAHHLSDLRGLEQLQASASAGSSERETVTLKLAAGYAHLECILAAACQTKERDKPALPEDISLSDARGKTQSYCDTLRSEYPRSKKQCP